MKRIHQSLLLLASTTLLSCEAADDVISDRMAVEVYELILPKSGAVNEEIFIQLKARATNGCYSDLKIRLMATGDKHFLATATALFSSSGTCPAALVLEDTTVSFNPASPGKYYFQLNEAPLKVLRDTIEIK